MSLNTLSSARFGVGLHDLYADVEQPTLVGDVPSRLAPYPRRPASQGLAAAPAVTEFQRHRSSEPWRDGAPQDGAMTVAERIEGFRPRDVDPRAWLEVEPLVKQWVGATGVANEKDATRHLTVVTRLLVWCWNQGMTLRPEVVLHVDTIERFSTDGQPDMMSGSRASYRSLLRNVGEVVLGPDSCPTRQTILTKSDPEAPYSTSELGDLYGAIKGLTTEYRRDNAAVAFETCIAGGFSTTDFTGLVGTDIRLEKDVVAAYVSHGPRPRRVVLKALWEKPVLRRAQQVGERPLFIPERTKIRSTDVGNFLDRIHFEYLPKLKVQRLRITWIVDRLTDGVPPHVVAEAAGISGSQLARYFQFVPGLDRREADRLLRGDLP